MEPKFDSTPSNVPERALLGGVLVDWSLQALLLSSIACCKDFLILRVLHPDRADPPFVVQTARSLPSFSLLQAESC